MMKSKWTTRQKAIRNLIELAKFRGDLEQVKRLEEEFKQCAVKND